MFAVKEIQKATKGKLLQGKKAGRFPSISTNSRAVKRGELFIPLFGKKHDGHKFIAEAFRRGAAGTLISKKLKPLPKGKIVIRVKDTQRALQDIALFHRRKFTIPVIGITGSSGKTTTKDMIAAILSKGKKTLKSEQNYNNEIGVPLTLLKLSKKHRAAVIEMAMQRPGEIEELAGIVLPTIAVITNVGEAHMQFFKSKKKIAEVKAEIFKFLRKKDFAVLNSDDEYLPLLKRKARRAKLITFGLDKNSTARATEIKNGNRSASFILNFKGRKERLNIPLPGIHNVMNALAAAAAGISAGASMRSVKSGLKNFKLSSKRMDIKTRRGIRVINDSYNANPSSMKAALTVLSEQGPVLGVAPPRRIAVLGDMLELGRISKSSHIDVGRFAAKKNIDILLTKGYLSKGIAAGAKSQKLKRIYSAGSNEEAKRILRKLVRKNDVILIKGSRGMRMEEIAETLLK
jgi:UDP-N-acetylmuramoyl-tripeptide--D-alanyl-D-alanine ligase